MQLTDYVAFKCSIPNRNSQATVQLILEDFQLVYTCDGHDEELRHKYPDT